MAVATVQLGTGIRYEQLRLVDPLRPSSWIAITGEPPGGQRREQPLSLWLAASQFFDELERAYGVPLHALFVSIDRDRSGRHRFVSLADAAFALRHGGERPHGDSIAVFDEAALVAERQRARLVVLKAENAEDMQAADRPCTRDSARTQNRELCGASCLDIPVGYCVALPELSRSDKQQVIMCDENTLCSDSNVDWYLPGHPFDYLKLIVNCHDDAAKQDAYKLGACSRASKSLVFCEPRLLCHAVHTWNSLQPDEVNRRLDAVQSAMWTALQHGSVAVHCLSGAQRAACIVGCHFLWRYYILGHSDLPGDVLVILQRLCEVWPGLVPSCTKIMERYKDHLERRLWNSIQSAHEQFGAQGLLASWKEIQDVAAPDKHTGKAE